MEKKERNARVKKIYLDETNKNIDQTVKVIEKIPELAKEFAGKSIRRSCMGILQSLQVWEPLKKAVKVEKEKEITKKELAGIFCEALEIELGNVTTLLNLKKLDIAVMIEAMSAFTDIPEMEEVQKYIDKQEVE